MDNNDLVKTLNNLIETSKDGEEGFRRLTPQCGLLKERPQHPARRR
jgi:hypothetical protein